MSRAKITIIAMLIGLVPIAALADEIPDVEQVRAQLLLQIPGYWSVADFEIEASANYGTEIEPVIKQRFTAIVELSADTFALERKEDAITWLTPIAKAGEKRTAFGIAASVFKAGAWQTEFALENNPVVQLGQPRDYFSGRTIVRGSQEEAQLRKEAREAELAQIAHQTQLEEEQRKQKEQQAAAASAAEQSVIQRLTDDAKNRLGFAVPGFWKLTSFNPEETVRSGDAAAPTYTMSFNAEFELTKDTFVEAEKDGPVVILTPVAKVGDKRTIIGTAASKLESDAWTTEIVLEGSPPTALGQPLEYYSGRVVVKGSPEEAQYLNQKHQEEVARHKREEELKEQERQAELARLAHEQRLREEQRKVELAKVTFEAKLEEEKQSQKEQQEIAAKTQREQQLSALSEALRSDDPETLRQAVRSAFASDDPDQQRIALAWSLGSNKVELQHLALKHILSHIDELSVASHNPEKTASGINDIQFGIKITAFNAASRSFTGTFVGSALREKTRGEPFSGSIAGVQIALHNSTCTLTALLKERERMEGDLSCRQGAVDGFLYDWRGAASITLPVE